jgi:hypothetical protein
MLCIVTAHACLEAKRHLVFLLRPLRCVVRRVLTVYAPSAVFMLLLLLLLLAGWGARGR